MSKKNQTYWYMSEITNCVICGREKKYRYRVYEKPEISIKLQEDACQEHFV